MKKNKIVSVFAAAALMVSAMPFASISANAADDDITGNTMLTAEELTLNKVVSSESTGSLDHDWYVFTLTEPSKINIICQHNAGNYEFFFNVYDEKNLPAAKSLEEGLSAWCTVHIGPGALHIKTAQVKS